MTQKVKKYLGIRLKLYIRFEILKQNQKLEQDVPVQIDIILVTHTEIMNLLKLESLS